MMSETPEQARARARLARDGDVDQLAALSSEEPEAAYKWLTIAHEAGHAEAADRLSDLDEHVDRFRYDDDGFVHMEIALEVAGLYLRGELVPLDRDRGRGYLLEYLDVATTGLEDWRPSDLDWLVQEIPAESAAVVRQVLADQPFHAVEHRVSRLRRLHEIGSVPAVIIDHEIEVLRESVDALATYITTRRDPRPPGTDT